MGEKGAVRQLAWLPAGNGFPGDCDSRRAGYHTAHHHIPAGQLTSCCQQHHRQWQHLA